MFDRLVLNQQVVFEGENREHCLLERLSGPLGARFRDSSKCKEGLKE